MTRTSKTLVLTLAALVCLHTAGPVARADDSSGGVVSDWLLFSGGFSNAASSSSGIMATNGNGLFVSDLNLGGSIDVRVVDLTDGSAGFLMIQSGSLLIISNNFAFAFPTNGFYNLGGSGIVNSGTLIINGPTLATPEPATWLLTGLGLLLILRTHASRRPSA
jgi:hypothetical protein